MTQQVITAFFDSRSEATKAIEELVKAGIPQAGIRLMPENEGSMSTTTTTPYDTNKDEKGFWASLEEFFFPEEDRFTYAEAMHRGTIMVSASVDSAHAEIAEDILEKYGTVNIEEREASWRKEGWSGYTGGSAAGETGSARANLTGANASAATTAGNEAIPVVEEHLRVGKRQVSSGRVRIRSYVVETPVQEQVNLRQERVSVERRPVDRPVTGADEALFRERTIDAVERSEEAVVSKDARVKEEVVVKKNVEDQTQTVQDTVRRTEVDVEDDRTGRSVQGTADKINPSPRR
jgi:uncharacterized protein (TIGR02271 family)